MRDAQLVETTQELNRHIVNLLDSLSALYGLTDISIRNLDETRLLREALEALMSNQDMERCSIFLLDDTNLLTIAAGLDWDEMLRSITRSDEAIPLQARKKTQFRLGEGILGRAAESGNIEHCRSCADDPQFKKIGADDKPVQGSLLCVPITCEERILGVINVYYPEPDFFNMWHERLLLLFCKMLGRLLINHRLMHQMDTLVSQRTQELAGTNEHLRETITQLQDAQAELRIAATAFEAEEGMFITDAASVILRVNKAFTKITGYTAEEAVGSTTHLLKSGRHDAAFYEAMWKSILHTGSWQGEIWNRRKNGEIYPERLTITAVRDVAGEVTHYVATLHDITERRLDEEALRASENRYRLLVESSPLCIHEIDLEGRLQSMNRAGLNMLGLDDARKICGIPYLDAVSRQDAGRVGALLRDAITNGAPSYFEFAAAGDVPLYFKSCFIPIKDTNGKVLKLMGITEDITERKQADEQIYNLAFYDTLTQLPNRRLLNDRLMQIMASSKRSGRYGALMFLDLDNFKPLNDMYGHHAGDLLLMEVARRISGCVREVDTVARFGGDEFIVILGELDADKAESTAQARIVAEKIRAVLAEPYLLKLQQAGNAETAIEHHCAASIGVVIFNSEAGAEDVLKWADMAMYRAKESGRNRIYFYGS